MCIYIDYAYIKLYTCIIYIYVWIYIMNYILLYYILII